MWLNHGKYLCARKGALSATFPEKVTFWAPISELLGSLLAPLGAMGPTLAAFLRSLVPPGTFRVPDRILVIFQGPPWGRRLYRAAAPGHAFSDISRKSEVFVWKGCKFEISGFPVPLREVTFSDFSL